MKKVRNMKTYLTPTAAAVALALTAGSAHALDVYLAAKAFDKALPDGSTVPMWGYVEDPGGTCYLTPDPVQRDGCVAALDPTLPGPRITVPPTDGGALTIHLMNYLPEPTSIVIPGQALPLSLGGSGPTWNDGIPGSTGPRAAADQRVRSFGREALPNGGTETYSWTLGRSGSFIYHSGTHPQKQVYMGLYGAVTQDAADGRVVFSDEPPVSYDNEIVLFYSDIDPALNAAIDDGSYITSIEMDAKWHLINGEPFEPGLDGTDDLDAFAGRTVLLRLFSTASETVVPMLQGGYMDIHAEDGFRYNWQESDGTEYYVPRTQYSAQLPPLRTKDAILEMGPTPTRFAIYEGGGHMTNPTDPSDFGAEDDSGGMLRFVNVIANTAPTFTALPASPRLDNVDAAIVLPISLQVTATDPDTTYGDPGDPLNDILTYAATGLPSSLSIDSVTGEISGNLTAADSSIAPPYSVTVTVTDLSGAQDSASFDWIVNTIPTITSPGDQLSNLGDALVSLPIAASDLDIGSGDTLSYAATGLPPTLTIGSTTGEISGSVDGPAGNYPVTVTVTDLNGAQASAGFNWLVNTIPTITSAVLDQTSEEGETIALPAIVAEDLDGNTLSFSATGLPPDLTIDGATGAISGTINYDAAGPYTTTVTVDDGLGGTASASFAWTVNNVNRAPVISPDTVGDQTSTVGIAITNLQFTATDPDGDTPLTYGATGLPTGVEIDATTGLISGTPTLAQGLTPVTVTVSDGDLSDSVIFNWAVNPGAVNNPPIVTAPVDQTNDAGTTITPLPIVATDGGDGGTLDYSATGLPLNLTIDSVSGIISGTIDAGAGSVTPYSVTVNVSDGFDTTPVTFNWTVNAAAANIPPIVTSPGDQTTDAGTTITPLPIVATDGGDGGTLDYSATGLPLNLTIDSVSGIISGTIDAGAGSVTPYSVTVNVSDGIDTTPVTFNWTVNEVVVPAGPDLYFSTLGGWNANPVPDVAAPYDDADVYTYAQTSDEFDRVFDARSGAGNLLPGNADIDGLHYVDADTFYVSFDRNGGTTVPGIPDPVQDEDVVLYDAGAWTLYFDGSDCGLDASNGQDIDAISVDGTTLYFSTLGGGSANPVAGVTGAYDDADVYTWQEGTTTCGREFDARSGAGLLLPGNADIDGLTVKVDPLGDLTYYMSFNRNDGAGGTAVSGLLGVVGDEDVVSYDGTSWSWYVDFDGTVGPLTNNGQDIDAIHVP